MKLFEYLGAGKAIIASDIPSVREVLKHAETGYLIKPDDHEELAISIDKVLKDNDLKTLLENNAKKLSILGKKEKEISSIEAIQENSDTAEEDLDPDLEIIRDKENLKSRSDRISEKYKE